MAHGFGAVRVLVRPDRIPIRGTDSGFDRNLLHAQSAPLRSRLRRQGCRAVRDLANMCSGPRARRRFIAAPCSRKSGRDGEYFDEAFFAYREDADLAWRAQWLGWRCLYVPEARGFHARRVLPERRASLPAAINMHSFKNRFLMRVKNMDAGTYCRFFIPITLRDLMALLYVLAREWTSLPGITLFFRALPRAWAVRRALRRHRRVAPADLRSWFSRKPVARPAFLIEFLDLGFPGWCRSGSAKAKVGKGIQIQLERRSGAEPGCSSRSDHRGIVGGKNRRRIIHRDGESRPFSRNRALEGLLEGPAQQRVASHASDQQDGSRLEPLGSPDRLGQQRVDDGLLVTRDQIEDVWGTRAPARASGWIPAWAIWRRAAVLNPLKLKSRLPSLIFGIEKGNARGFPRGESRSITGPPGYPSPRNFAILSSASPAASSRVLPAHSVSPFLGRKDAERYVRPRRPAPAAGTEYRDAR